MKGIIFNAFQSFVVEGFGRATYEKALKESQLDGDVFISPENYEDQDFFNLVSMTVELLELSKKSAVRSFGRFLFGFLAKSAPHIVETYKSPSELLMDLDDIIHVEVRKVFEGAKTPTFSPQALGSGEILLSYSSQRDLPCLVEGLLQGMGDYFKTEVTFEKIPPVSSEVVCHFKVRC